MGKTTRRDRQIGRQADRQAGKLTHGRTRDRKRMGRARKQKRCGESVGGEAKGLDGGAVEFRQRNKRNRQADSYANGKHTQLRRARTETL